MDFAQHLRLGASAFTRGDMPAARREGQAALRIRPGDPRALQLMGIVCCQSGDVKQGAAFLRHAIDQGADTPDTRLNLARALVELGQLAEAEEICRTAPGVSTSRDMQRMHADVLKAQGRHWEAITAYEQLVASRPDDFEAWNNLGNARHATGDFEGAQSALQRAKALNPQSPLVHINMGRLLISMDRYEEACLAFEQAALRAPQDPAPLLELGRTLTSIDHPAAALKALGNAARLNPRDSKVFVAMGVAFNDLGDLRQAEQANRLALQADPAHAPAYVNLGILLEKANRLDEFNQVIDRAKAAGAEGSEIDYLRALSLSRKGAVEEALDQVRSVQSPAIHPATVAHFAGQLADRLNRVDEAYTAFEEMNRAAAQSPLGIGVDREAYQRGIDGLADETTPEWFASWREVQVALDPPSPAFLVGFPRSGTTLLDTFLMGHEGTHVLEEIPILETISNEIGNFTRVAEMGNREVADFRARYFAELQRLSPPPSGKLVIDKNPLSMLRVPLIHRLFPDAKIILTLRHPCDVVLSCYMQNFKVTEAMASFLDLTNASRTYDRIFTYWERCRATFPIQVHTLRYETMVLDPEAEMRPLLDFLGLPWDASILNHQQTAAGRGYIRTPSYAQVTEGLYARALGRWERYRHYMREVLPILAPWVERLGYGDVSEAGRSGEPRRASD
jgi:Flp pilus assembly protein TadD